MFHALGHLQRVWVACIRFGTNFTNSRGCHDGCLTFVHSSRHGFPQFGAAQPTSPQVSDSIPARTWSVAFELCIAVGLLPGTALINPNPPSQTLGPALSTVRVAGSAVHSDPTQRCFEKLEGIRLMLHWLGERFRSRIFQTNNNVAWAFFQRQFGSE